MKARNAVIDTLLDEEPIEGYLSVMRAATVHDLLEAYADPRVSRFKPLVCQFLGRKRARSAIPMLLEALEEERAEVRSEAADSLGQILHRDPKVRAKWGSVVGARMAGLYAAEPSDGVRQMLLLAMGAAMYAPAKALWETEAMGGSEGVKRAAMRALELLSRED